MAGYAELLKALDDERREAYTTNPWIRGGAALGQKQLDTRELSGPQRFALSLAQGLGSGVASGYGQAQADDEYRQISSPILEALNDETKIPMLAEDPDTARFAPILETQNLQRRRDFADKIDARLLQDGLVQTNQGVQAIPSIQQNELEQTGRLERLKSNIAQEQAIAEDQRKFGDSPRLHPEKLKLEQSLAKDFQTDKRVQKFEEVNGIFKSMLQSNELIQKQADNLAPDMARVLDLDLIIGGAKINDPISVVREGEVETVRNTGTAISSYLQELQSQVMGGTALTKEQRRGLIQMASQRRDTMAVNYNQTRALFEKKAQQAGLDPSFIARGDAATATKELNPSYLVKGASQTLEELAAQHPNTPEGRQKVREIAKKQGLI